MCNNSLYKKRNLEKETNLEEAPIGKLDMNKFAPLADLGEDNDKSEKEPIEKFLFQQNKWNNSHVSQSDSYTFTSQMGENRRRKSNHQKANTSAKQVRVTELRGLQLQQWKLSHYQEQPHRKEQNVPRTDHRKPDKADYSVISEASEALQSLVQSCSSSMKKSFKQNNQSFRSQKQTEHNIFCKKMLNGQIKIPNIYHSFAPNIIIIYQSRKITQLRTKSFYNFQQISYTLIYSILLNLCLVYLLINLLIIA
ncbi:Hypothetical_protein [Hexamita inflata]|uniref:Hypothetical_protein n=1 Tax=Hexamita inflata TaxID=28002 RepID=A0AA86TKX1_9EUKA|nr:Hypothetical protein HINF_LOCUS6362 [Hexamita inflata]